MAFVLDAARPAQTTRACAMSTFTQPTPRQDDMDKRFRFWISKTETVVPGLNVSVTPVNNTADAANTIIGYAVADFWNASTPKTVR